MKITDKMRLAEIIRWANEAMDEGSGKTLWAYNLISRRNIDAAIRASRSAARKRKP